MQARQRACPDTVLDVHAPGFRFVEARLRQLFLSFHNCPRGLIHGAKAQRGRVSRPGHIVAVDDTARYHASMETHSNAVKSLAETARELFVLETTVGGWHALAVIASSDADLTA